MRTQALTSGRAGINLMRTKGGPRPDTLRDLVNAYIIVSGAARPRPGTVLHSRATESNNYRLPAGTVGLTTHKDKLVVFSDHQIDLEPYPEYRLEILTHPDMSPDFQPMLRRIHFAEPFLGFLYVVAEWNTDEIFHYWAQTAATWQPNTVYQVGQVVIPTVPNGFTYRANRIGQPGATWAPNIARAIGDVVEPTTYNGFEYLCIQTYGASPRSGATEPRWPTAEGETVAEDTDGAAPPPNTTPQPNPGTTVPPEIDDRYGWKWPNGMNGSGAL